MEAHKDLREPLAAAAPQKPENAEGQVFIYKKMDPGAAQMTLRSRITSYINTRNELYTHIRETGKAWLIRESRLEGMLTVHSISYHPDIKSENEIDKWQDDVPQRFYLASDGWIENSYSPRSKRFSDILIQHGGMLKKITAKNAGRFLDSLLEQLLQHGFLVDNRINPLQHEQTAAAAYCSYMICDPKVTVELPVEIQEVLSCPLAKETKLMRDPVVLIEAGDRRGLLKAGVSYERENLIAYMAQQQVNLIEGIHYYPNHTLKSIMRYLSAACISSVPSLPQTIALEKLTKIESEVICPISLEPMIDPIITAAGKSYDKINFMAFVASKSAGIFTAIINDPQAGTNITGKPFVENINLRQFIKLWPEFFTKKSLELTVQHENKTHPASA